MNKYLVLITAVVSFALINTSITKAEENVPEQEGRSTVRDPRNVGRPAGLRAPKRTDRGRMDTMRRGKGRNGGEMSRAIMQEQQLEILSSQYKEKQRKHEAFIGQLNRILKSAQDEKADETAQLLEKLIEKQNHVFAESTKSLTNRRDMIRKQMTENKGQEKAMDRDRRPVPTRDVAEKKEKAEKVEKPEKAAKVEKAKEPVEEKAEPAAEEETEKGKKKGFWKRMFSK